MFFFPLSYLLCQAFLSSLLTTQGNCQQNNDEDNSNDVGTFIHVSDFHLDPRYLLGGDPDNECHNGLILLCSGPNYFACSRRNCRSQFLGEKHDEVKKYGYFGDCDASVELVEAALEEMGHSVPNPDFILWTGDSTAHGSAEKHTKSRNGQLCRLQIL